jgi:hypothetical protein
LRIAAEEIKLQRIVAFEVVMSKLRITGVAEGGARPRSK